MTGFHLPAGVAGVAAVVLSVIAGAGTSTAAEYGSLAGRWCGADIDYAFTRRTMTVRLHSGARRQFDVEKYESKGAVVVVHWRRDGKLFWTRFSDFDATGGWCNWPAMLGRKGCSVAVN